MSAPSAVLVKALDGGYRHLASNMLGWFLSEIVKVWGLSAWMDAPEDAQQQINDAVGVYDELVRRNAPFTDLLGPLYMEMASKSGKQVLGQYFTPWTIAKMLADMSDPQAMKNVDGSLVTACDPSCGSGVMLLALANTIMEKHGGKALKEWSLTGCDLDPYCAHMTAVQLLANCAVHKVQLGEVLILRGNSLVAMERKEIIVHAYTPDVDVPLASDISRLKSLALVAKEQAWQPGVFDDLAAAA